MQLILEEASAGNDDAVVGKVSSQRFVIENLKHVYFNASHESTAVAASWCLMLLALHPEWQNHIRTELTQVCGDSLLDADSLPHLKTVNGN